MYLMRNKRNAISRSHHTKRRTNTLDDRYDVVIVGSGIGGLIVSTLLAKAGKKVLVLEQHRIVGGNVTSFRHEGFTFDVGLHYVGECGPGERLDRILKACGLDDIRFIPMSPELEHFSFPDFTFTIPATKQAFHSRLIERFPQEEKGIDRYFKLMGQYEKIALAATTGSKWKLFKSVATSMLLMRYSQQTIGSVIDSCTANATLKAILNARCATYALGPKEVSSILHLGLNSHYLVSGGYYPENGTQNISNRLAHEIESAGSHISLRSRVREITVSNKMITGVVFENSKNQECRVNADIVVSNADLKRTVFELVGQEHFPDKFSKKIADSEMAPPLFVVFLGIDMPPGDLPFGNSNQWLVNNLDWDDYYQTISSGQIPDALPLYLSAPGLKDPDNKDIAPPNQTPLEVMTVVPPDPAFWNVSEEEIADGSYRKKPEYLKIKEQLTGMCIDQAERIIPNLKKHIVFKEAASPMTHTRYVGSTSGTGYGLAAYPSQFLNNRPSVKSPIDNLFFTGANCKAGHGIIGASISAVQAADAILGNNTFVTIFRQ